MDNKNINEISRVIATDSDEGVRLDKFLLTLLPESGLRQRRRLIEKGLITVNGRRCRSGLKMFSGAEVVLYEADGPGCDTEVMGNVSIIKQGESFAAVYKPEGIHSAAIAGSPESAVEECLNELFPGKDPILANRLDKLTSGMLLIAFGVEQENKFRDYEDSGIVGKFYYAKVHGCPESGFTVKNSLDTADRIRTKVLEEQGSQERWSTVEVVECFEDGTSLLQVRISKGARHQIRAHLAYAGFPIVGDPIYGVGGESCRMYLHHREITLPGFEAVCEPGW